MALILRNLQSRVGGRYINRALDWQMLSVDKRILKCLESRSRTLLPPVVSVNTLKRR